MTPELAVPPLPPRPPAGSGPSVALTFDDGPDPLWTPRILAALADSGTRATFFVITARAAAAPHLVAAIIGHGHEIGLHCARHVRHTDTTLAAVEADTAQALDTLAGLGVCPTRWRVPWGACAGWTARVAAANDLSLVGWTADTHDWRGDDAPTMLAAVEPRIRDRAIVLMHDGLGPGARRDGCGETVRLITPLADLIRTRGCAPASLAAAADRLLGP